MMCLLVWGYVGVSTSFFLIFFKLTVIILACLYTHTVLIFIILVILFYFLAIDICGHFIIVYSNGLKQLMRGVRVGVLMQTCSLFFLYDEID